MRPIPWILLAGALTALGILSTYEGQTTLTPPPGAPSLLAGRKMPAIGEIPSVPGVPGAPAVPTTVAVPAELFPPVTDLCTPVVPTPSLLLVIARGKEANAPVLLGPSIPPADGEAFAPYPVAALADNLKTALDAAGSGTSVCVVFGQYAHWDDCVRPVLEACATAGLYQVQLGVLAEKGAKTLSSISYRFFDVEGTTTAVLETRSVRDGGILEVRSGRKTFFTFAGTKQQRAATFLDDIRELHGANIEFQGAGYAAAGLAWAIRMDRRAWFTGLVEAATALTRAGISRFGLEDAGEAEPEDGGD